MRVDPNTETETTMSVSADEEERLANQRAYWLVAALVAAVFGVVGLAATVLAGLGLWGLGLGLAVAVLLVALAPGLGERLALRVVRARPTEQDRDPRLDNLVAGLCEQAKLPPPRLWVVESEAANAFAVGRGPAQAAIVVTSGLLGRREFQADERGAYLTRYPPGLIRALTKLREDPNAAQASNLGLNHLWIVAPGPSPGQAAGGLRQQRLFDTHPPLDERIEALREL